MNASALADYEVLVDDDRILKAADELRREFGPAIEDTSFVSFVQPARTVSRKTDLGIEIPVHVPEMAVFAAVTPNPRRPGQKILTSATVALRDWEASEWDRQHYVGKADPVPAFLRLALKEHLPTIQNLRDMI